MRPDDNRLFCSFDLRTSLDGRRIEIQQRIDGMGPDALLNSNLDALCEELTTEFSIAPLRLLEDKVTIDQQEVDVDVSRDRNRAISDRSGPFFIKGTRISFFVPFEGDAQLFGAQPSTMYSYMPHASVNDQCLVLEYTSADRDAESIRKQFHHDMGPIRGCVRSVEQMLASYNQGLANFVRQVAEARRARLLEDGRLAASLGFPLRKRPDAPTTYSVPAVKRKVVTTPRAAAVSSSPALEPALDLVAYDEILGILRSMVRVMERSPRVFTEIDEGAIRTLFLVTLNGQFEGQATGETFNAAGKTDILVRYQDRNLFIAECKFWSGPKSLHGAIDQLLGYATWRDGKLALLVFNRNKGFTGVISKIRESLLEHPAYSRSVTTTPDGTEIRCIVRHPNDVDRELTLTVLAFDVPAGQ